jgi:hypothetical protein
MAAAYGVSSVCWIWKKGSDGSYPFFFTIPAFLRYIA